MPILENPRQERFAQELAAGRSAINAYIATGYKPNYGNAIRLKGNERISARVAELQSGNAARAQVTTDTIVEYLVEARALAMKLSKPSVAITAAKEIAELLGLNKRPAINKSPDISTMTLEQCEAYFEALFAEDLEWSEQLLENARSKRAASKGVSTTSGSSQH